MWIRDPLLINRIEQMIVSRVAIRDERSMGNESLKRYHYHENNFFRK